MGENGSGKTSGSGKHFARKFRQNGKRRKVRGMILLGRRPFVVVLNLKDLVPCCDFVSPIPQYRFFQRGCADSS
jgi:hypothetical protein